MAKQNIVIEGAKIGFRNFSGKESKFNPKGKRNFCVFLAPDMATILEADGWRIRWPELKDEEDDRMPYLQVAVSYDNYPPKILLISGGSKTIITDETVNILDWAEIENVDLIIRPYNWSVGDKSGTKAYLKSMYVTIVEDEFEAKYDHVPFSGFDIDLEEDDILD